MATREFALLGVAVLLYLHGFSSFVKYAEADYVLLPDWELSALQDLLSAWNKSTLDVNSSLPGWEPFDPISRNVDPCYLGSWRGVFCYITERVQNATDLEKFGRVFDARVVSLTVSDASIIGTIPNSIWAFDSLTSLALTGNPGLIGPIPPPPSSGYGWTLKSLDLHGNGLHGPIPGRLGNYFDSIEDLDLRDNRLNGPLPPGLGNIEKLRTLKLSNNSFSESIPVNIFQNWTELVTADFSSNNFIGNLPDMSTVTSLHTLNLSHNAFGGQIDLSVLSSDTSKSLAILDLSYNNFTGSVPNLRAWHKLQSLNLGNNPFDAGPFPAWLSNFQDSLETLDLSSISLTGELNLSMLNSFTRLRTLELDDNKIEGTLDIARFLDDIRRSKTNTTLQTISLKKNQISKVRFGSSVINLPVAFELQGNPYCSAKTAVEDRDVQKCFCEQLCDDTKGEIAKAKKKIILIASVVGGILVAAMVCIAAVMYWKNRRDRRYLLLTVHEKFAEYEMKPTLFSYSELQKATRDFHPEMKLGEGGFGAVYKGYLADGSAVAVKQLLTKAQQNMDDFLNEVVLLTTVKHRNLVKLKGCCLRGDKRLLVYEYVDNYDLAEVLFEHKGNQIVPWPARYTICMGVAQGLHYLHAGVEPRIIHRDIKANNVLLDQTFLPKIADFGLALLFPNEKSHITIVQIAGTKGYLAPEYATTGQLSEKVDVFSFGVLALEVVSGRRNIDFNVPHDQAYLTEWTWKLNEEDRLRDLVDPTLSIQDDEEIVVRRVIATALACVQTAPDRRPTMAQVVGMLQGDIEIGDAVRDRFNESANKSYRTLLGLNSSVTTLMPVDEESQVLNLGGASSSARSSVKGLELSAVRAR